MAKLREVFGKKLELELHEKWGAKGVLTSRAGISRQTLDRWLAGTHTADLDQVEAVAKALGKEPVALLTEDNPPWASIPSDLLDLLARTPEAHEAARSLLMGFGIQKEKSAKSAKALDKPAKRDKKGRDKA